MTGVVIGLSMSSRADILAWVVSSPHPHPKSGELQFLTVSPLPQMSNAAQTAAHGASLRDQFVQFAPLNQALQAVFNPPPGTSGDLRFQLGHAGCEGFSWETLANPANGFIALMSRARVSRQVPNTSAQIQTTLFKPPLKIVAVMAALDANGGQISARGEWVALEAALSGALKRGEVVLELLSCEPDLRKEIEDKKLTGVTVEPIPASIPDLLIRLGDSAPHIVHFFCHGRSDINGQVLEMANSVEWLTRQPPKALLLNIEQLCAEPFARNAWLIVLNCCLGGAAAGAGVQSTNSMAMQLVTGGVSNAIGMSSPIDAADAHDLAKAFYSRAVRDLAPLLTGAETDVALDFGPALGKARDSLHTRATLSQTGFDTWTLPLLYEASQPLRVRWPAAPEPADNRPRRSGRPSAAKLVQEAEARKAEAELLTHQQTRIQLVAGFLRTLAVDAPDAVRDQALELLAQDPPIDRALWPDRQGQFPMAPKEEPVLG